MELTPDQERALTGILEFVAKPVQSYPDCAIILYAAAGCGKTFLTRVIADKLRGKYTLAGVAPTHKARKVLHRFLNNETFYGHSFGMIYQIKTMTVASLLSKLRDHSYIGTKNYRGTGSKVQFYDLFIIDEASMITDEDIKKIITYAFQYKRKLIFVGDKYQIPNPAQKYVIEDGFAHKADSVAFNIPGFELTTNMRQQENPIVPIYLILRQAIAEKQEAVIPRKSQMNSNVGVKFFSERDKWIAQMAETFLSIPASCAEYSDPRNGGHLSIPASCAENRSSISDNLSKTRIIVYTNDAVKMHNMAIRKLFGRSIQPEFGELLMGYNNVGFPEPYVCNGQDYYITDVRETVTHQVLNFTGLAGLLINIKECDSNIRAVLFVPDIGHPKNQGMLAELVKRAEKVNTKYSTKREYKSYCDLRNKLIFMENIYKFRDQIVGETQFRSDHPLLFKNLNDTVSFTSSEVLANKLTNDIEEKYGELLKERLNDDKSFSDVEKLCDKFCIIEKDIDYGYAVTAHKSQGSTYKTVFIDEPDFDKLKDHYNYSLNCDVKAVKEKNQLKYVSYTRPTDCAYVYYKEVMH